MKLARHWQGYLSGTNRGRVFIILTQRRGVLRARGLFYDQTLGPARLTFEGELSDQTATLRLVEFCGHLGVAPLDGAGTIEIGKDGASAQGRWQTDIGTSGTIQLRPVSWWRALWLLRRGAIQVRAVWYRTVPTIYCLGLLALAVGAALGKCTISWQAGALLLLPAPLLFQNRIWAFVTHLRIQKAGPVVFATVQQPALDLPMVVAYLDDRLRFERFSWTFVPRTQILLRWLAGTPGVSRFEFENAAKSIGVEGENLQATVAVLISSGCALPQNDKLVVTELGRRYLAYVFPSATGGV